MTDHIRYDILAQDALRGLVRKVLTDAARNGLPGEHHFYVTFDTHADGVRLSSRMRAQYPEDMTIVLQHQFWDLKVTEEAFEVGLSFGGVAEKLAVPFAAIVNFSDPSAQFALQFETIAEADGDVEPPEQTLVSSRAGDKGRALSKPSEPKPQGLKPETAKPAFAKPGRDRPGQDKPGHDKPGQDKQGQDRPEAATSPADADPDNRPPEGGAEVVRLDRFRKK